VKLQPVFIRVMVLLALLAIWEFASATLHLKTNPFPAPSTFLASVLRDNLQIGIGSQASNVVTSVFASVTRVIVGLAIAVVLGVPVGIAIAETTIGKYIALPVVQLLSPIAPIAWIPIALAILGIGDVTAITIVFLGVFFLFVLTVANSVASMPQEMRDSAHVLGLSGLTYYSRVLIPAILPQLVNSMRVNFPAAWMAVLAAEMTGLRDGLGAIVMTGRNLYDYNLVMFGVFFIAIIGLTFDSIISVMRTRFFWW
jgi:NitT/TauT family transport system permease protein